MRVEDGCDREAGDLVPNEIRCIPRASMVVRLADAGHTRDAYADRASGGREQAQQQLLRLLPVIAPGVDSTA